MKYTFIIIFLFIFIITPYNQALAQDEDTAFAPRIIGFYKKYISRAIGSRCPMYPSCSTYCVEAFKKHGYAIGWIMTCDRLLRCGRDEIKTSDIVYANGGKRCYDPVDNNDFWW